MLATKPDFHGSFKLPSLAGTNESEFFFFLETHGQFPLQGKRYTDPKNKVVGGKNLAFLIFHIFLIF